MSAPCPTLGFLVTIRPHRLNVAERAIVADLESALERAGLSVRRAGGGAHAVVRDGSQATNADRELVREWAERWAADATIIVGDVVDLGASG